MKQNLIYNCKGIKPMKKALSILLLLTVLCSCLFLTGCGVDPYFIETWYLTDYTDENGESHGVRYDTIKQERFYADDITLQYFEDGTFIFKEFDKEYTGTYTYKSGRKETSVVLTFSDGTKGKGTCAKYMFDGVWYIGTLQAFGKEYAFYAFNEDEPWHVEDEKNYNPYTEVGKDIRYMMDRDCLFANFNDYSLHKCKVENTSEEYVLQFYKSGMEVNATQIKKLYTYEVAEDYTVERGNNTLKEGECFVIYSSYRTWIDSENYKVEYDLAVWYY